MKGIVFHFKDKSRTIRLPRIDRSALSFGEMYRRFGKRSMFVLLFLLGLIVGAACSRSFDQELFSRFDFLFLTNIESRLSMSTFGIFISCFTSYMIFTVAVFLSALTAWGFAAIPFAVIAKGFSIGLSSALVFALYHVSGIGFYILIILPGAALYLFTLVRYSIVSFSLSLRYMRISLFGYEKEPLMKKHLSGFLKKSLYAFISSAACAVLDMLLWILFADQFQF